jgi:flagellar M-ring protein FliF
MATSPVVNQFKDFWNNIGLGKKVTFVTLIAGTLTGLILLSLWASKPDYGVLFSGLSLEDSAAIYQKLKTQKVPYQIADNGRTILVPRDKVYELRLSMAANGLPDGSSVGFELFDNARIGMTDFMQNVNYQRALQGELERTIDRLDEVESSRVHIVMASNSLFSEDSQPATASVVLKLKAGRRLSRDQVRGITHLVASSVSGLNPEHVILVNSRGRMLAGNQQQSEVDRLTTDQLAYQEKVQHMLEDRVRSMLESALGRNKAIVRVSVAFDFQRREKTEEQYLPDNQVIRSEKIANEDSSTRKTLPAGIPGAVPNMTQSAKANGKPQTQADTGNGYQKADRTVNYEIGKVVSHVVEPVGVIKRISVAALVDGTYRNIQGKDGKTTLRYFPRSPEEMQKLENLIKRAVNIDDTRGDKIEVDNIPFAPDNTEADTAVQKKGVMEGLRDYLPLFKYAVVGLFVLLAFFFVVRPLVRWVTTNASVDTELLKQLPMTVGEMEKGMGGSRGYREQAVQLLTSGDGGGIDLMKAWLDDEKIER